ncbi:MAG: prepilin peptidase [Clostridia bacterium]|nr:prepilin peptidase [Clostridia bacterium]
MQHYEWIRCLIGALFGYVVGGYVNTLEYRLRVNERTVTKGCHCPHCGRELLQRDQIPILSYLLLKGKCRYCKTPIGIHYPLVEAYVTVTYTLLSYLFKPDIMPVIIGGMVAVYAYIGISLVVRKAFHPSWNYLTSFLLMCFYHIMIFVGLGIINIAVS